MRTQREIDVSSAASKAIAPLFLLREPGFRFRAFLSFALVAEDIKILTL